MAQENKKRCCSKNLDQHLNDLVYQKFLATYQDLKTARETIEHQHAPRMSNLNNAEKAFLAAAEQLADVSL